MPRTHSGGGSGWLYGSFMSVFCAAGNLYRLFPSAVVDVEMLSDRLAPRCRSGGLAYVLGEPFLCCIYKIGRCYFQGPHPGPLGTRARSLHAQGYRRPYATPHAYDGPPSRQSTDTQMQCCPMPCVGRLWCYYRRDPLGCGEPQGGGYDHSCSAFE